MDIAQLGESERTMSGGDIQVTRGSDGKIQQMHPMVERAIAASPSAEGLRELLQVQREWEAGEAKKSFTRAMVALKRELPMVLERDKTVTRGNAGSFKHTTLAAAVDAVTGPLCDHNFSVSWTPGTDKGSVSVTCTITHEDGHTDSCTIAAPPDTSGSKNPAQAVASTITLLQRYTLLSLLGIATKDQVDPEPQQASGAKVDSKLNLATASWVKQQGYTVADAAHVVGGTGVQDWTTDDVAAIREALKLKKEPKASKPRGDLAEALRKIREWAATREELGAELNRNAWTAEEKAKLADAVSAKFDEREPGEEG